MAGPKTDKTGQIQAAKAPPPTLQSMLVKMQGEIARALPRHVTADRMSRVVLTALRTTPNLAQCSTSTFLGCVLQCAQLGLEPNTPLGHAYLIPRWSQKDGYHYCSLILGYQGMIDLARRSGHVTGIYARVVRDGDLFEYQYGLHEDLKHKPSIEPQRESRPITHVYAVARMRDADPVFEVLTKPQIDARRNRAQTQMVWKTDEEAMTQKTAIRALYKWLPKSPEMARADAIETAMDTGAGMSQAFDPSVTDALDTAGLPTPVEQEQEPTNGESNGQHAAEETAS